MKFITVRVTKEFDHRLRLAAAQMDMSRSRLVRLALKDKLDKLDREASGPIGPNWAEFDLENNATSDKADEG